MLPECARVQLELGVEELLPRGAVHDGQTRRHTAGLLPDVLQPGDDSHVASVGLRCPSGPRIRCAGLHGIRSEEHTSELQSLMRISYAVFCLKKKKKS